jgi:DNA-binding beta-propeller fold protein YncE
MRSFRSSVGLGAVLLATPLTFAGYTNFEVSHVHPIDLAVSGGTTRLLAVNTSDAMLEVFTIASDGSLVPERSIAVGLEPVTVLARTGSEAWVVNQLSDTVSIVDLDQGLVVRTLAVGNEPTDVAFAAGKAFVSIAGEDVVRVYNLADLSAPPSVVSIFSRKPRALAVSPDGSRVYCVPLLSGNQTTIVPAPAIWGTGSGINVSRLGALGLTDDLSCQGPTPFYPPLPAGIERNPALPVELDSEGSPRPRRLSIIVRWNDAAGQWQDEFGQDWSACVRRRLPDQDLFVINASTLGVTTAAHLGTTLFDVSVNPASGKVYVPNTDARNLVRFEHPLGLRGHVVDNRFAIVDPATLGVTKVDLNSHIDRSSDPQTNLPERQASVAQPGMLVWNQAGTTGYLTALGSSKVFRVAAGCSTGSCIFGPSRPNPVAVTVGNGPTGVALDEAHDRLYVLNRVSHTITVVAAASLTRLVDVPLHDASGEVVREGREYLYDALRSAHGDASCASCHVSADRDDLAWELGNPEDDFVPYGASPDNVRFITPGNLRPIECAELNPGDPFFCAAHDGFDPQKGPMVTRTLRAMLEPLHTRGDRPTFHDFNEAFVTLLGSPDVGPVQGKRAGLSAEDMELFRQFVLAIEFPPNPLMGADGALPNASIPVPGTTFSGNPTAGLQDYLYDESFGGRGCRSCHTTVFGATNGQRYGVVPALPTSLHTTALVNGDLVETPDNDFETPDLRSTHEKIGARSTVAAPNARSGYGLGHDGSFPDIGTFMSRNVFSLLTVQEVRDVSAFLAVRFPIDPRPAVGKNLTLPAGPPPTGPPADEVLLATLMGNTVGDPANVGHHCELTASARVGSRVRKYQLVGGVWVTDVSGEAPLSTSALRTAATGPITFLCAPIGSGARLGGDRDEDGTLDGTDCAAADATAWSGPVDVTGLAVAGTSPTLLAWDEQAPIAGPGVVYEVLGGSLAALRADGVGATTCLASSVALPYADGLANPGPGDGRFYLVRARNGCGVGSAGPGREALSALTCSGP